MSALLGMFTGLGWEHILEKEPRLEEPDKAL